MGVTEIIENVASEATIKIVDLYNLLTASEDKTVLFLIATLILAFYAYVVLLFYRKLSKRDMFEIHLEDKHGLGKVFEIVAYIVRYIILFPTYTIFWFVFLSYTIIFLGGGDFTHILFLAALVLSATRLLAYFNQTSAGEIAKLLPFVFLSAVLINPIILEQKAFPSDEVIRDQLVPQAISYLKIIVGLEISLRILYDISLLVPHRGKIGGMKEAVEEKSGEPPKKKKKPKKEI